jgi:uncharacterized membrane protein
MSSIVLGADTLLGTTPAIGSVEFDGKAFYATAQGTQRGIIPGAQFFRLNSDLAGANVSTAQSVFGVSVTLSTSTVYAFEGIYLLSKTAGATSHTIGTGFGGSATINNIGYSSQGTNNSVPLTLTGNFGDLLATSATATAVIGAIATATVYAILKLKGTVSINGGGTFTPQYILSAAPGGAYSTVAGSYFLIYPLGASGANTSVGAWA